jgi:hypothetical protein
VQIGQFGRKKRFRLLRIADAATDEQLSDHKRNPRRLFERPDFGRIVPMHAPSFGHGSSLNAELAAGFGNFALSIGPESRHRNKLPGCQGKV